MRKREITSEWQRILIKAEVRISPYDNKIYEWRFRCPAPDPESALDEEHFSSRFKAYKCFMTLVDSNRVAK